MTLLDRFIYKLVSFDIPFVLMTHTIPLEEVNACIMMTLSGTISVHDSVCSCCTNDSRDRVAKYCQFWHHFFFDLASCLSIFTITTQQTFS